MSLRPADPRAQCKHPGCEQRKFLPEACKTCAQIFCPEHIHENSHSCQRNRAACVQKPWNIPGKHVRVAQACNTIVCPLCLQSLEVPPGENSKAFFERHQASRDCFKDRSMCLQSITDSMSPRLSPNLIGSKRQCPVQGCLEMMTVMNSFDCAKCRTSVCLRHSEADAHDCESVRLNGGVHLKACSNDELHDHARCRRASLPASLPISSSRRSSVSSATAKQDVQGSAQRLTPRPSLTCLNVNVSSMILRKGLAAAGSSIIRHTQSLE